MLLVETKLGLSKIEGIGCFAAEFIPAGTVVWELTPGFDLVVTEDQLATLPAPSQKEMRKYAYHDPDTGRYTICMDNARHFNHADDPNTVNGPEDEPEVTIAARDIQIGEELTSDYTTFDLESKEVSGPNPKA